MKPVNSAPYLEMQRFVAPPFQANAELLPGVCLTDWPSTAALGGADRQGDLHFEAAFGPIAGLNGSSVNFDGAARDAQAQASAAELTVPCGFDPIERLKQMGQALLANPGTVIADQNENR